MVAVSPNPAPQHQAPPPEGDLIPLSTLLDPRYTLDQLARQFNTTEEAISIWMLQPEIQARIEIIQAATIQRARIAAHRALPAVATACHSIITTFNNTARPEQLDPDDHPRIEHERRNAETARRAGALLLRLARFRRTSNAQGASRVSERSTAPNTITHTNHPSPASATSQIPHPNSDIPTDLLGLINSPDFQSALATALNTNQSQAAQAAGVQHAPFQSRAAQAAGAANKPAANHIKPEAHPTAPPPAFARLASEAETTHPP